MVVVALIPVALRGSSSDQPSDQPAVASDAGSDSALNSESESETKEAVDDEELEPDRLGRVGRRAVIGRCAASRPLSERSADADSDSDSSSLAPRG